MRTILSASLVIARKLKASTLRPLEELNIPKREQLSLTLAHCIETMSVRKNMLQEMQQQLKNILGLDLAVKYIPWSKMQDKTLVGQIDFYFVSWCYFVNTPFYFLDSFQPSIFKSPYQWQSDAFSRALTKLRKEKDPEKQQMKLIEIKKLFYDECPIIPIYYGI